MKRILSLVAVCVLLLPLSGGLISARGDDLPYAVFTSGEVLARPGDTFTYEIFADTYNAPVSGLDVYFDLNSWGPGALIIESAQPGPDLAGAEVRIPGDGGVRILWECLSAGGAAATGRFLILSLTLTVPEGAETGDICPEISAADLYYIDLNDNGREYDFETDSALNSLGGVWIIEPAGLFISGDSTHKTEYFVGDQIDTDGLILHLYYNESADYKVVTKGYTVNADGFSDSPGQNKAIIVEYLGESALYDVNVRARPTVSSEPPVSSLPPVSSNPPVSSSPPVSSKPPVSSAPTVSAKPEPTDITGSQRKITATHIGKIPLGMSVGDLIAGLDQRDYIEAYKDGKRVTSGAVSTGMELRLVVNGQIRKTKSAYVTGDVNGDGRGDITDLVQINFYILKKSSFSQIQMLAANINNDDRVDITDLVALNFYILKKSNITPN